MADKTIDPIEDDLNDEQLTDATAEDVVEEIVEDVTAEDVDSESIEVEAIDETTSEEVDPNETVDEVIEEVEAEAAEASEAEGESSEDTDETEEASAAEHPNAKNAKWYVVHTYSGHENKAASNLKQRIEAFGLDDKIFDVLVPTQEKIEIKEGKKRNVTEQIFPGYMLVKMVMSDESWHAVRNTPGVTSFVGMGTKPLPLPEHEVAAIQKFAKQEAPKFKTAFSVNEAVKIIDGPFAEFTGRIDDINEAQGKLKVLVEMFGRETPVELDFLQVSKNVS